MCFEPNVEVLVIKSFKGGDCPYMLSKLTFPTRFFINKTKIAERGVEDGGMMKKFIMR